MVTVESKKNVYINSVKSTIFIIRNSGVFIGEFSVKGWGAADAACLKSYNAFSEI